jgi:CheY-like chemotaxis protein
MGYILRNRHPSSDMDALVLVVDDNDDIREMEVTVLGDAGYRTLEARSGRQALSFLKDVTPSVVVLDFMMADIDGIEVARAMQEDRRLRDIPTLIITAAPHAAVAARMASCRVDVPVLSKPINPDGLTEAVRSVERSSRPSRPTGTEGRHH